MKRRSPKTRVDATEFLRWKAQETKTLVLDALDEELAQRAARNVSRTNRPQSDWAYAHIEFETVRGFENEFLSRGSAAGWALVTCTPTAYVLRNRVGGR